MRKIEIPDGVMGQALHAARQQSELVLTVDAVRAAVRVGVDWLAAEYHLTDDRHLVNLTAEGWTIQHPMACRPTLFSCPFNTEMAGVDIDDRLPAGVYEGVLATDGVGDKILNLRDLQ